MKYIVKSSLEVFAISRELCKAETRVLWSEQLDLIKIGILMLILCICVLLFISREYNGNLFNQSVLGMTNSIEID